MQERFATYLTTVVKHFRDAEAASKALNPSTSRIAIGVPEAGSGDIAFPPPTGMRLAKTIST